MGQHKTEEKKEIYFVFFSKKQREIQMSQGFRVTFAKLENGRIVKYTELCLEEKPSGNIIDDYVLLGKGDFYHFYGASKDTTVETKGTIFRRKIDLFKLLPGEKFKLKSPKNIFKKRPYGYF